MAAAALIPSFVTDYTFVKTADDAIPRSVPHFDRPAKFWYGASLPFRVEESINILDTEISSCNFYETIGILHDASVIVAEALDLVGCVDHDRLMELRERLPILKKYVQECFKNHLLAAKATQPEESSTYDSARIWFDRTMEFIKIAEPFAVEWKCLSLWEPLHLGAFHKYHKCLEELRLKGAASNSDKTVGSQSSKPTPTTFRFEVAGQYLVEDSTTDEVVSVFVSIIDFYKYWYRQEVSADNVKRFSIHFDVLRKTLEILLAHHPRDHSKRTLKDKHIDARTQLIYEGWCNGFRKKFCRLVFESLAKRQSNLEATIGNEEDLETAERQLYSLATDLREVSFVRPEYVCKEKWSEWSPYLVWPEMYESSMLRVQQTSNHLQLRLSASCEIKRVWFDLYRSLVTTYMILEISNFVFPDRYFPLERRFFQDAAHQKQFEKIMREPMIANPITVENIVTQYCVAIAHARMETDSETFNVRLYQTDELRHTHMKVINTYHQSLEWDATAIRLMQKMAVRLNHLTGGPAYIRRAHPEHGYWHIDLVKLDVRPRSSFWPAPTNKNQHGMSPSVSNDRPSSISRTTPGRVRFALDNESSDDMTGQNSRHVETSDFTPNGVTTNQTQIQTYTAVETLPARIRLTGVDASSTNMDMPSSFPSSVAHEANGSRSQIAAHSISNSSSTFVEPFSFDQISSFDYVSCQFPESRAIEVATSRQISRELNDQSLVSLGPMVKDVINKPPKHTQSPGKISVIGQYLPYGPWDVLKNLWHTPKRIRSARSRRSVTPRYPRKLIKRRQGDILSLQKDTHRVTKSTSSQTQTRRVPKLRGGGALPPHEDEPVQMLINRINGFWGTQNPPTIAELITNFLAPAGWNVDRAYLEVRSVYVDPSADSIINPASSAQDDHNGTARTDHDASRMQGTNALFPNPEPFNIFVDPSQRTRSGSRQLSFPSNPSQSQNSITSLSPGHGYEPLSSDNIPAGNQDHQRQRDEDRLREQQGIPPRRRGDNSSDEENRQPLGSLPLPDSPPHDHRVLNDQVDTCAATLCHRCPVFSGQYHHVCTDLDMGIRMPSSQPLTNRDSPIQTIEGSGQNTSGNRLSSSRRSRSTSEIPDSQDGSVLDLSQAPARTAVSTNDMPRASAAAGNIPETRITRGTLAQINSQRATGTPLSIAQARALIQTQINAQTQGQPENPILIGVGPLPAPATRANRPVVPNPVTPPDQMIPSMYSGPPHRQRNSSPASNSGTRPASTAPVRPRVPGRWRANSRGSPNVFTAEELDLNSSPPPKEFIDGQLLGSTRHPHRDSSDSPMTDSQSPDDSSTAATTSRNPAPRLPPIPFSAALGPQRGPARGTGPDPFTSPFGRIIPPQLTQAQILASDLFAAAAAAFRAVGGNTTSAPGTGGVANANVNVNVNANAPTSRRANSLPARATGTAANTNTNTNATANPNTGANTSTTVGVQSAATGPRETRRQASFDFNAGGTSTRRRRGPSFWSR